MAINLLGLSRKAFSDFLISEGEKPYRAQQLIQWIHQYGMSDFDSMTNLSKSLREKLARTATIVAPEIGVEKIANDGTYKWMMRLADGNSVETVFIPEIGRGTLCVSSQVGCVLNCSFCSTGKQGFNRNLSSDEIIGQVWRAVRRLSKDAGRHDGHITNVVMMGMGEPLLNFDNVIAAMDLMMDDFAYGLAKKRVTLSTSGVVPAMLELKTALPVALAVSLHAPNDALRNQLVPINKKYPLEMLMSVCRDYYPKVGSRVVTMEYVMLDGVNDTPQHAKELVRLLQDVPCKLNLIPFNPFPNTDYVRSSDAAIEAFKYRLSRSGIVTTVRKTRGDDVDAACGQLVGEVNDRTKRRERLAKGAQKIIFHRLEKKLLQGQAR